MITRYVNPVTGSSTPADPNTDPYDTALNALSPLIAEADDITLICSGAGVDTSLVFPNFSGYSFTSLTIIGDWVGASATYDSNLFALQSFAFRHRNNIVIRNIQLLGPASGSGSSQTLYGGDYAAPATCWAINVLIDSLDRYSGFTEVRSVFTNTTNLTINLVNCIIRRLNLPTTTYGIRNNLATINAYNCIVDACGTNFRNVSLVQNCATLNPSVADFNTTTNIFNTASAAGTGTDGITVSNWALEFTDAANGDYTLLSGSQLRNSGLALPAGTEFSEDVTGATRSQGSSVDVGPYEFSEAAAGDSDSPILNSGTIDSSGDIITFNFNESVNIGTGGGNDFTLVMTDGVVTATYSSGAGSSNLVYSLNRTVYLHETGYYLYTQPGDGIEDSSGNDLVSVDSTSVVNNSLIFNGSISTDSTNYEPGQTVTITLSSFSEIPTFTLNGITISYTGDSNSGTITIPDYDSFVLGDSGNPKPYQNTPWNENISIIATQTGGTDSSSIQIDPPSDSAFFYFFLQQDSGFSSSSIFSDDMGIEIGDFCVGRILSGQLDSIGVDGVPVWNSSNSSLSYKIWDSSISEWSNESIEYFSSGQSVYFINIINMHLKNQGIN